MSDQRDKRFVQESIDSGLSAMQGDPWLAQRITNQERTSGFIVKRKLSVGLVLAIVLMLIAVTALAVALLTPKEVVEQVALPMARDNGQANYSYDELKELLTALNENGITLDEGSRLMQAFNAGHGYWERDALREICLSAFGPSEGAWTIEQRHWYGEMMVAIGAYGMNINLIPEEGDMTIAEAHTCAVRALEDAFHINLPEKSDEDWIIYEFFNLVYDIETDSFPPEKAVWHFVYIDRGTDEMVYDVLFDRAGENIITEKQAEDDANARAADIGSLLYPKEQEAIEQYGEIMYFWPREVLADVYGDDYTIPAQEEYENALRLAENAIKDKYGADALIQLGAYRVGVLHKRFDDIEMDRIQHNWDFMFSTDPEFLSDGYRVQFVQFLYSDGTEVIDEVIAEPGNMGNG